MCTITYTSLDFDEAIQTLTLVGRSDCQQITASLSSPNFTIAKTVGVQADGSWTIVYSGTDLLVTVAQIKARCGVDVKINAFCTDDPTCRNNNGLVLNCINSQSCPAINLALIEVADDCINGTRNATFEITISNFVNPSVYEINFGDIDSETFIFSSSQNPRTVIHPYSGGTFTAVVNSILPENCTASNSVLVNIPVCDENCPEVQLSLTSISNCNKDGTRTAIFGVTITNALSNTCVYEIDFGDGNDQNIQFDSTTPMPMSITHNYTDGNYSAIVNSFIPEGCPSSNTVLVQVQACQQNCPNEVEFEIIDGNGNRFTVIDNDGVFEAIANNPLRQQVTCLNTGNYILRVTSPNDPTISFVWREGQNTPIENTSRDFPFQLLPDGNKSITVIIKKNGCTDLPETITIRECSGCVVSDWVLGECINGQRTDTRTIITQSNDGSACPELTRIVDCDPPPPICDSCCIWNWINIGLFIVTSIFILITFCLLEATAVTAILNIPTGGTLSAIVAALSTLNIVMLWICLGLLIVGLISFILWLIFCVFMNPEPCCLLQTLMVALSAITASSLVLFFLFLILQRFGCVAGAVINLGWFGFMLSITTLIYTAMGCFNRRTIC